MKLYYLVEKINADKNNDIIVPILEKDRYDKDYNSIYLFDSYFNNNVIENYNNEKSLNQHFNLGLRVFNLYSIETENLHKNISLINDQIGLHKLHLDNPTFIDYKENYQYVLEFQNLDWIFEKILCLNKINFLSTFIFTPDNDTKNKDIEMLLDIIIKGDSVDRLLRLNKIVNDFNNKPEKCAKELYEILYDFSLGDYFDINSEIHSYYNAMEFLKNLF